MSVYRKENSPFYHYDFQFKGRRFHGSTGSKKRSEALAYEAREREKAVRAVHTPERIDLTIDEAAGRYYVEVAEMQSSVETTEYQIKNLLAEIGKTTLLCEINDGTVASYIRKRRGHRSRNAIRAHGKTCRCTKCLVSPASVNREVQLLRRIVYRARDVWKVETPKVEWKRHKLKEAPPRTRVLSDDEETRLIEAAAPHLKRPIRFSVLTGVRLDNVLSLDWRQIDLHARAIRFIVKGGKNHVLPISDELFVLLANLGPKPMGPVFTYKGKAVTTWKTAWKAALRRAGIEDFRWHDLRHTTASRLVRAGVDISAVQEYLAHADIATTRRYVHHDDRVKLDAMNVLSRNSPEAASGLTANVVK